MASLSISRAWDETRGRFARDGRLLASVALALILLPQAVLGLANPPSAAAEGQPGWVPILVLIAALLGLAGQIAIARLSLGEPIRVGDAISHALKRMPWAFLALVLFGLAMILVLLPMLFLVAGPEALRAAQTGQAAPRVGGAVLLAGLVAIAIGVRFQMIVPAAAAEPGGAIRLLKRSWALTAGHYWRLLAFILLLVVATVIIVVTAQMLAGIAASLMFDSIAPFSGGALVFSLLVAAAQAAFSLLVSVMLARIYVQLSADERTVSVPSSAE